MVRITITKPVLHGLFGVVLSLGLILVQMGNSESELVATFRRPVLQFVSQFEGSRSLVTKVRIWLESKSQLEKQILTYELRLRKLEADRVRLSFLQKENEDLKASFVNLDSKQWMGATLLFGGNRYLIDVGKEEGVQPTAIVLARGGYFGVVDEVRGHLSSLNSIFDAEARLAVRVDRDGAVGVLRNKKGELILTTISRAEGVRTGDKIATLGDEQVRVSGLMVGTVDRVLTRPADPVSTFVIKPNLDVSQLRAVVVSKDQ